MPSYDVSSSEFHDRIAELERSGERIVSVVAAGDGAYKVITDRVSKRKSPGEKETRS